MAKQCIGVDLGGTFIKFGLLDAQGRAGQTSQLPTPVEKGVDGVIEQMAAGVRAAMKQHKLSDDDVLGVGIGAPGPLDLEKGVVIAMPNIPGMENAPLRDQLSQAVGRPAVLENDANAAAYGEYLCGAGRGVRDMVLLTLGTGIGSGIILDGQILHGAHKVGGEVGHMIVEPDGEPCGCGQRGCLERYCSATHLAEYATRLVGQGRDSCLAEVLDKNGDIDAGDINRARQAGDALAAEVWDRGASYIALACVNICRIIDPDEIVLAGGMTKAGEDLMGPVRRHFHGLHWRLTEPKTTIAFSVLGNDAGAIGAAGVAWSTLGGATWRQ